MKDSPLQCAGFAKQHLFSQPRSTGDKSPSTKLRPIHRALLYSLAIHRRANAANKTTQIVKMFSSKMNHVEIIKVEQYLLKFSG